MRHTLNRVNILTCRIKAMRKLVTEHVTNGSITQRPEIKEHLILFKFWDRSGSRKNDREVEAWARLCQRMDYLGKSFSSGSEPIRNEPLFF